MLVLSVVIIFFLVSPEFERMKLIKLEKESVLQLDSRIEDPVDVFVGDRLVARGELEEIDGDGGHLGVRLTEVADLSDGL